jgi:amino acid transporter
VFTTYAVDVAFGPAGFSGFGSSGTASWEGMARSLYGLFWFFVFLAIVNSTIANANAGVNVASRTGFALGRIGAFPPVLAQVHPRHRSPVVAIVVTFVLTVAVTLGLGLAYNPVNAFAMVGTGIAAFVPAWLTAAGIRVFSFIGPLTAPASYMAPGVAGFMIVGVIYLVFLYIRDPRRVTAVGLVHIDAPELER